MRSVAGIALLDQKRDTDVFVRTRLNIKSEKEDIAKFES
jgi:hypothetical protein